MPRLALFEDFTRIPYFFYVTIGILPYDDGQKLSKFKERLLKVNFFVGITNLDFNIVGQAIYVYDAIITSSHFIEATGVCSCIGFVFVSTFKIMSVWMKKDDLSRLMSDLKDVFPKTVNEQKNYRLLGYLKSLSLIMKMFSILYMFLIWTFNLFTIVQYFIQHIFLGINSPRKMPYYLWTPIKWDANWGTYTFEYLKQSFAGYTSAAGIIASDLLICCVVMQLCMQFDYISRQLETYRPFGRPEDDKFLNEMIEHSVKIFKLTEATNNIFGLTIFINFMTSSLVLCFVGFQVTIGAEIEVLFKYFLYLLASLTQVYLISYFGHRLMDANESIGQAAYKQYWYNSNDTYKKSLIFIMAKTQTPAMLMATRFLPVSLTTFTTIIHAAYKFFTLLRTMYWK